LTAVEKGKKNAGGNCCARRRVMHSCPPANTQAGSRWTLCHVLDSGGRGCSHPSSLVARKGGLAHRLSIGGGGDCVYCLMSDSPFGRKTQSCGGYHLMLQLRESGSQLCSLELRQRKCGIPPLQMTAQGLLSTRQSRPSTQGDHMAARAGGGGAPRAVCYIKGHRLACSQAIEYRKGAG
jgi:hypothetical protein